LYKEAENNPRLKDRLDGNFKAVKTSLEHLKETDEAV
jgi:hypothetical protein